MKLTSFATILWAEEDELFKLLNDVHKMISSKISCDDNNIIKCLFKSSIVEKQIKISYNSIKLYKGGFLRINSYYRKIIFFSIIFIFTFYIFLQNPIVKKGIQFQFSKHRNFHLLFSKYKELKESEGFNIEVLNINSLNGDKDDILRNYFTEKFRKNEYKIPTDSWFR